MKVAYTHIEPLLRAHLLNKQHLWYPQLHAYMRDSFSVHKVLLQPHMTPDSLLIILLLLENTKSRLWG